MSNERPERQFGIARPEESDRLRQIWSHIHWQTKGDFNNDWKNDNAHPLLQQMSQDGKLGRVVVDVAAGHSTLVRSLRPEHVVGTIDIVPPGPADKQDFAIRADLRTLHKPPMQTKRDLIAAKRVLLTHETHPAADTFVFSDILNYVDFRKLLRELDTALNPGGRFVIFNKPDFGAKEVMEPDSTRLRRNSDLIDFLVARPPAGLGYELELPKHRDYDYLDRVAERLQIVVRKPEVKKEEVSEYTG